MERRSAPLQRVRTKILKFHQKGKPYSVQIDDLSQMYYSEELECGHIIDLNILSYRGRWGDNAKQRRCPACHERYHMIVDATLDEVLK